MPVIGYGATGYAPSTITNPIGASSGASGVITPEIAQQLQAMWEQHAMMGQHPGWEPPQVGEDATEYLTNLYYRDAGLATQLAESAGIDRNAFLANVRKVDQAAQASRGGGVFQDIGNLTRVGRGEVENPLDFVRDAATLGAIGYGTSFLGGGAGAGGTGTATVSGTNTAAGVTGGVTTTPYVAGGTITGSAIPGVTSATTAANAAAAGIVPAAGGAASALAGTGAKNLAKQAVAPNVIGNAASGLGLGGWLTAGSLAAQALQGNKDMVTNSTSAPPAYIAPYLSDAAQQASNLYGQGNYVAPITQSAINYGTNVLGGNYLNSNPYLDETLNKASGAVTNQVQSNFSMSGRNPRGIDAAGFAQEGYNDLANQIYGGNYQAERQRMQQLLPYAGQLGAYTNPGTGLDDYIARLRNLSGGYGTNTSSTPTESNMLGGLAGLGLALMG